MTSPALRARGVAKAFGATQALAGIDVELGGSEVHGLIGENGSGKSTLVKILAGVYRADRGSIEVDGRSFAAADAAPGEARRSGISVVHQDAPVFPMLSVAENLFLGRRFPTKGGRIRRGEVRRRAAAVLERYRIPARPATPVRDLGPAVRAMISIARALQDRDSLAGGVLVLDEPTAGLNDAEVTMLLEAIVGYAREGQAIALVSHRLDEILTVCDRVTVLRDGRVVASRTRAGLDRAELVRLMIGAELDEEYRHEAGPRSGPSPSGEPALAVEELRTPPLRGVSLAVAPGEVVGIAGLLGAGGPELLRAVHGALAGGAGGVEIVPADRGGESIFPRLSVGQNLLAGRPGEHWRAGFIRRRAERAEALSLLDRFEVKPRDPAATMSTLSGGNQQKVVIARALRRRPRVLLLDEPSQGVDVGARAEIHRAVRTAAAAGTAVLVSSSDVEELVGLCDRIVVLVDGRIGAEVRGEERQREAILGLMHEAEADHAGV